MQDHDSSGPTGDHTANGTASWNEALAGATRVAAAAKGNELATLQSLIDRAPLTAEQRALAELFLSTQGEDNDVTDLEDLSVDDKADASHTVDDREGDEFDDLQAELEALREVNDTLAAALGACPLCWGGDEDCECEGRGHVGAMRPDSELFDELVAPAVKRMIEARNSSRLGHMRRRR